MMFIKIGDQDIELSTKLGIAVKLEKRFNQAISDIGMRLGKATSSELLDMLAIAAGKNEDRAFKEAVLESWDFSELFNAANELFAHLMFAGTPEQINEKIENYPVPDAAKNALRAVLGIPPVTPEEASTGGSL